MKRSSTRSGPSCSGFWDTVRNNLTIREMTARWSNKQKKTSALRMTLRRKSFYFLKKQKKKHQAFLSGAFCGAPPGTRTLGPLIKRASRQFVSIYGSFDSPSFLIKTTWFFTQQFLHPLSDFAAKSTLCTFWNRAKSVQKPCTYSLTNKIALFPTGLTALVWVTAHQNQV